MLVKQMNRYFTGCIGSGFDCVVTETMAIAAAARSPRATCWGPSGHARGGLSLLGRCGYDEEQLGY